MPDPTPFNGGGFESPVNFGDKGIGKGSSVPEQKPGPFDMRWKGDKDGSEQSGHSNG